MHLETVATQEMKHTTFRPPHEKFHTVVVKGLRNISGTLQDPPVKFLVKHWIWCFFTSRVATLSSLLFPPAVARVVHQHVDDRGDPVER